MTTQTAERQSYELPSLGYDFNALEPFISAEIMEIHYTKHHNAYVTNLNKALEQYAEAARKNDLPAMTSLLSAIKFNGEATSTIPFSGQIWPQKTKGGGEPPSGLLSEAIRSGFGSLEKIIESLSAKATAHQGSGWVWLGYNKPRNLLEIAACDNQDPLSTKGLIPLLGIDVWEHAYYLQYKNVRPDYIKSIWNVVNWSNVAKRYEAAVK